MNFYRSHRCDDAMTPAGLRRASAQLDLVRQRRELLFWTISMTFGSIVLFAITVGFVWSLVRGASMTAGQIVVGAGITGAAAAGGKILGLVKRSISVGRPE